MQCLGARSLDNQCTASGVIRILAHSIMTSQLLYPFEKLRNVICDDDFCTCRREMEYITIQQPEPATFTNHVPVPPLNHISSAHTALEQSKLLLLFFSGSYLQHAKQKRSPTVERRFKFMHMNLAVRDKVQQTISLLFFLAQRRVFFSGITFLVTVCEHLGY